MVGAEAARKDEKRYDGDQERRKMKNEEGRFEVKSENQWWSAQSALSYPMLLLSYCFRSSAAFLLPPSCHPGRERFAAFAPWCRVNCMCLCFLWVCRLSFRFNLPKAVHVPGIASLPGPPISRLPTPSVFACVHLELGFPRCLPHPSWEDAICGVGP